MPRGLKPRSIGPWPESARSPAEVASEVGYLGSAEHKAYASPAGPPALRSDASRCPELPSSDWEELSAALQRAVTLECTSSVFEHGFPRYVWGWFRGTLYECRYLVTPRGGYKAYPLEAAEYPVDPQRKLRLS